MSTLNRRILPGFRLSLSYAVTYLTTWVISGKSNTAVLY